MRRVLYAIVLVLLGMGCAGGGGTLGGGSTGGGSTLGLTYELRWVNGGSPSQMFYGGYYPLELWKEEGGVWAVVPDPYFEFFDGSGGPIRDHPTLNGRAIYSLFPNTTTGTIRVRLVDDQGPVVANHAVTFHQGPVYNCRVRVVGPDFLPLAQVVINFRFDNLQGTVEQQWTETGFDGERTFTLPQNTAHMYCHYFGIYKTAVVGGVSYNIGSDNYIPVTPASPGTDQIIDVQLLP